MTTRVLLTGIVGGIVMFIWSFIAHDVLPLGEAGISEIPNEQAVLDAMKTTLTADGLYWFPGRNLSPNPTRQEKADAMKQVAEKAATGPSGMLLYHPTRPFSFGKLLGVEFITELIESILVVFLLAQSGIASFGGRVGFVLVVGIISAIATNIPYWNWYGFPTVYTAAYVTMQVVGLFCVGVVAALMLGQRRT